MNPSPPRPQALRLDEAAHALNVSRSTVRNYVVQGLLRAIQLRPGGALRIPASEIDRLMQGRVPDHASADIDELAAGAAAVQQVADRPPTPKMRNRR